MNEAVKILEMIENVDPSNEDALDEIDARFHCWLRGNKYNGHNYHTGDCGGKVIGFPNSYEESPHYTRSRDALKSIRPDGWIFLTDCVDLEEISGGYTQRYTAHKNDPSIKNEWAHSIQGKFLPTEELAELHAIIQAIQWERENAKS